MANKGIVIGILLICIYPLLRIWWLINKWILISGILGFLLILYIGVC
jgi:hypothetical protein